MKSNAYCRKKMKDKVNEIKSRRRLFAFHKALIPLGKS